MIAFDEEHPLKVLGDDEFEIIRRETMIHARLDKMKTGTTGRALAKVANVGERTMQALFKHPEGATTTTVYALCEGLGVDISCIRGYADPMTPEELEALYMDEALTDEDRRLVAETLQHLHRIRKPPRFRIREADPDAAYEYDWVKDAMELGKEDAENL